jgi:hypothetical protein
MPDPVVYDAIGEALFTAKLQRNDHVAVEKKIEERDPIWNFEHIPLVLQEQTDLRAWMSYDKPVRLARVKEWITQFSKREGETLDMHAARKVKLRRILLFVIGTEASSAIGSRDVAAEAFKSIFPKE